MDACENTWFMGSHKIKIFNRKRKVFPVLTKLFKRRCERKIFKRLTNMLIYWRFFFSFCKSTFYMVSWLNVFSTVSVIIHLKKVIWAKHISLRLFANSGGKNHFKQLQWKNEKIQLIKHWSFQTEREWRDLKVRSEIVYSRWQDNQQ